MLKGINIGETRDFVSKLDKDKNNPTIFKIGVLDSHARAGIMDMLETDSFGRVKNQFKYSMDVVRFGLKGIVNFGHEFKTVKIMRWGQEYEVVDNLTLARIPVMVIDEIATEIINDNIVSEKETKN